MENFEMNDDWFYKIKPLEWPKDIELVEEWDQIRAQTPFGSYYIKLTNNSYRWGYCFDEYYDEDEFICDSIEDGKIECWKHWTERLSSCLNLVM